MDLPTWLDEELWQAWIEYRRTELKKPASETSQKITIRKLTKLKEKGYCPTLLIEKAMEHEWRGIYAHDDCKINGGTGEQLSAVEQFRAANSPRARLGVVGGNG